MVPTAVPRDVVLGGHPVSPGQEDMDGGLSLCANRSPGLSLGVWAGHRAQGMVVEELNVRVSTGSWEVAILFKDTPRDMEQDKVSYPQLRDTSTDHSTNWSFPGSCYGKSHVPPPGR